MYLLLPPTPYLKCYLIGLFGCSKMQCGTLFLLCVLVLNPLLMLYALFPLPTVSASGGPLLYIAIHAFFICACIKPSCAQRPLLLPFLPPPLYVQDRFWFFVKYKSGRVSSLFGTLWFPVTPQIKSRLLTWPPGPLPSLLNLIKCCFFSKQQSQWLPQFQAF